MQSTLISKLCDFIISIRNILPPTLKTLGHTTFLFLRSKSLYGSSINPLSLPSLLTTASFNSHHHMHSQSLSGLRNGLAFLSCLSSALSKNPLIFTVGFLFSPLHLEIGSHCVDQASIKRSACLCLPVPSSMWM